MKFLNDIFNKTILELRYEPAINKLNDQQKEGLVKIIDKSRLELEEKNKIYSQFIADYYFNSGIDYNSDGPYNQAINEFARKTKKNVKEIIDLKSEIHKFLKSNMFKSPLENKINQYISQYNLEFKGRLERRKSKQNINDVIVKTFRQGKRLISNPYYSK